MHGPSGGSTFLEVGISRPPDAAEEVDDVEKILMTTTATGLSSAVRYRFGIAPSTVAQGTAVPCAGSSPFAQVAVVGVRSTDLPGIPPRGAPV